MKNLFVIPQAKESIISTVENGNILENKSIAIPYNSKSVITDNNLIISLCFDEKSLRVYDFNGNQILEKKNFAYKAIACKKNTIFLGGEYNNINDYEHGEMFSIINFDDIHFNLQEIDLPIKKVNGKSIDDILIHDNQLILVDNVIYPKYILYYDLTNPNYPLHKETHELPNNGTYEHIIKGDINKDWMVLFSSTVGMSGSSKHISISGKSNGLLSTRSSDENKGKRLFNFFIRDGETYDYIDICLLENKLFILRNDCLGYINLNKRISNDNFIKVSTKISDYRKILKTPANNLVLINETEYELIE